MDLKHLEAFVCVADTGSFSKAARRMYLTQPTVSAHVRSLESEVGTQLIVRTPKFVYPTAAGQRVYRRAAEILRLRDEIGAICAGAGGKTGGAVAIAASTIPCQHLLPAIMADFRTAQPAATFRLVHTDSAGAAAAVLDGKTELGVTGTAIPHSSLVYREIYRDNLVVITPPTPLFAEIAGPALALGALLEMPFIVREAGSGTRIEAENLLRAKGIDPSRLNTVAQMDNPDAIINAVNRGLGIAIVSKLSAESFAALGLVRILQLEGEPLMRSLFFVHHKYNPLSQPARDFLDFAAERTGGAEGVDE